MPTLHVREVFQFRRRKTLLSHGTWTNNCVGRKFSKAENKDLTLCQQSKTEREKMFNEASKYEEMRIKKNCLS